MNAVTEHWLDIRGRRVRFRGDVADPYFQGLPSQRNLQLDRLAGRVLSPDAVCVDAGAGIGLTALTLAAFCPRGRVHAFEPSPRNVRFLEANVRDAGAGNIEVLPLALGRAPGRIRFNEAAVSANSVVVREGVAYDSARLVEVDMTSLDEWHARARPPRVDLVKIDVEGYEEDVLIGAAGLLATHRPLVFMEFNSVTVAFEARVSPLTFAEKLWSLFKVGSVDDAGEVQPAGNGHAWTFALDNMVRHGCVEDVAMRLRPGISAGDIVARLSAPR